MYLAVCGLSSHCPFLQPSQGWAEASVSATPRPLTVSLHCPRGHHSHDFELLENPAGHWYDDGPHFHTGAASGPVDSHVDLDEIVHHTQVPRKLNGSC